MSLSQQCISVSLIKIHQLVQKIMHGYKSGRQRDPHQQYISPPSGLGGHNNLNFTLHYLAYLHLCDQKSHMSVARIWNRSY